MADATCGVPPADISDPLHVNLNGATLGGWLPGQGPRNMLLEGSRHIHLSNGGLQLPVAVNLKVAGGCKVTMERVDISGTGRVADERLGDGGCKPLPSGCFETTLHFADI